MSDFRLKVFYSVAKNLSFTKASQELFVSQPAITKHIRELESLYQTRLFNRLGNTISLTESGNVLLEHCERILAEYRKLEYDMHLLHNEYKETFHSLSHIPFYVFSCCEKHEIRKRGIFMKKFSMFLVKHQHLF